MSSNEPSKAEHKTKKFGKGERNVPHHTQKAKKFYPAEDEAKPRKVRDIHLFGIVEICSEAVGMPHSEQPMLLEVVPATQSKTSQCPAHSESRTSWSIILIPSLPGPEIHPRRPPPQNSPARHRPHPPCRPFPRQTRHPPQAPSTRRSTGHRPLQSQWRTSTKSKCTLRHCYECEGGAEGYR